MAANWDPIQTLNSGRVEWPKGDIDITDLPAGNFVPRWVDAWVVQGGGMGAGQVLEGPSQSTSHSSYWSPWTPPYNRWTADTAGWVLGTFQAGQPALGISVLAWRDRNTGTNLYEWWFDFIVLQ
ncbi:hypothetical protein CIT31_18245 [Mesorhizobium wenxiniae]|uniref:Uncharacterized protein n=1 Tax=Mesorhizobium wenxiniae TaxID=2014805 RepID=A0A271KFL7_9HYPH|nr:hypothetical protein CIT31_18245 [Mesorhizobium wenxiniae]